MCQYFGFKLKISQVFVYWGKNLIFNAKMSKKIRDVLIVDGFRLIQRRFDGDGTLMGIDGSF